MNQKYQQLNESHLNLLEELRSSTEEYETLKGEMAERSHTVQDTAPLAKIKDARNHGCLFDPRGGSEAGWLPNFRGVVLGCMDSYDSEKRRILQGFSRSTRFSYFCTAQISKFQQKTVQIFGGMKMKFHFSFAFFDEFRDFSAKI